MKNKIKTVKSLCQMRTVTMEWAIEELARISERCSNTVQDDILTVIDNLKRSAEYEISNKKGIYQL